MKTLNTIQKACHVFKILAKIAMILSFVCAGIVLAGLLCGIAWRLGGHVMGVSMENALEMTQTSELDWMIGKLLSGFVCILTDGLLFLFAYLYLKQELSDGTPFTVQGADLAKGLGIKTIVMPQVAVILSAVIYKCFDLPFSGDWGNGSSLALGIALILFSLVLRYGAELRGEKEK